jgi:hypothetical protein
MGALVELAFDMFLDAMPTESPNRKRSPAKPSRPRSNGAIKFRIVGLLFVTGICGGHLLGKSHSPNFGDPTNSPALIRSILRRDSTKRLPDRDWQLDFLHDGR